ncbi:MAG TPA: hypothetical protein VGS80_08965 [Ktedonobacterales bacterium]|nr:hypothetical protein [Ktedonobacterales bacterium]
MASNRTGDLAAAERRLDDPVACTLLGVLLHLERASFICARLPGVALHGTQLAGAGGRQCTPVNGVVGACDPLASPAVREPVLLIGRDVIPC